MINVNPNNKVFHVSSKIIWFSSLFMGILASVPKILQLHITIEELMLDSFIAFVFSLLVWYTNIYNLPKFENGQVNDTFFNRRLVLSLCLGITFMIVLVGFHHLILPQYDFKAMALMYQFRAILINLTIYMLLNMMYQSHYNQQVTIELERTKSDNLGAQYELLKQQVNPHFLFNSLNTLKSMVEIGDEHSADFILKLSDFYRFTLENRKMDLILLAEEVEILNAYVYLLEARFEHGFVLHMNLNEVALKYYIPPFTLQLLIENCIKHNVVSLENPLVICIYIQGDYLVVENKLQLKKVPSPSTGVGLENINQRYLHLINKPIVVTKTTEFFKVSIPIVYEYSNH